MSEPQWPSGSATKALAKGVPLQPNLYPSRAARQSTRAILRTRLIPSAAELSTSTTENSVRTPAWPGVAARANRPGRTGTRPGAEGYGQKVALLHFLRMPPGCDSSGLHNPFM